MVKSYHLTDIIILVCCSMSLFTHSERLRIWMFGVRVSPPAPDIARDYINLIPFKSLNYATFVPFKCQNVLAWALVKLLMKSYTPAWLRCRSCLNLSGGGAHWPPTLIHKVVLDSFMPRCFLRWRHQSDTLYNLKFNYNRRWNVEIISLTGFDLPILPQIWPCWRKFWITLRILSNNILLYINILEEKLKKDRVFILTKFSI